MERHGFVEGTSGITYVHKKDDRRHRKHCVHYRKDGSCAFDIGMDLSFDLGICINKYSFD